MAARSACRSTRTTTARRPVRPGAADRRPGGQGLDQLSPAPAAHRLQQRGPPDRADGGRRPRQPARPRRAPPGADRRRPPTRTVVSSVVGRAGLGAGALAGCWGWLCSRPPGSAALPSATSRRSRADRGLSERSHHPERGLRPDQSRRRHGDRRALLPASRQDAARLRSAERHPDRLRRLVDDLLRSAARAGEPHFPSSTPLGFLLTDDIRLSGDVTVTGVNARRAS